ncbi:SRF-type transcription factor [Plasmodiophora brassicae]
MGKVAVAIARIHDKKKRSATYLKRSAGLIKKAETLAALSGSHVVVVVRNRDVRRKPAASDVMTYTSGDINVIYSRYNDAMRSMLQEDVNDSAPEPQAVEAVPTMAETAGLSTIEEHVSTTSTTLDMACLPRIKLPVDPIVEGGHSGMLDLTPIPDIWRTRDASGRPILTPRRSPRNHVGSVFGWATPHLTTPK